jgi:hypothetical protein
MEKKKPILVKKKVEVDGHALGCWEDVGGQLRGDAASLLLDGPFRFLSDDGPRPREERGYDIGKLGRGMPGEPTRHADDKTPCPRVREAGRVDAEELLHVEVPKALLQCGRRAEEPRTAHLSGRGPEECPQSVTCGDPVTHSSSNPSRS